MTSGMALKQFFRAVALFLVVFVASAMSATELPDAPTVQPAQSSQMLQKPSDNFQPHQFIHGKKAVLGIVIAAGIAATVIILTRHNDNGQLPRPIARPITKTGN